MRRSSVCESGSKGGVTRSVLGVGAALAYPVVDKMPAVPLLGGTEAISGVLAMLVATVACAGLAGCVGVTAKVGCVPRWCTCRPCLARRSFVWAETATALSSILSSSADGFKTRSGISKQSSSTKTTYVVAGVHLV